MHNLHNTHAFHVCGACDRCDVALLHVVGLPLGLLVGVRGMEGPLARAPPCLHLFEVLPSLQKFLRQRCPVVSLWKTLAGWLADTCVSLACAKGLHPLTEGGAGNTGTSGNLALGEA